MSSKNSERANKKLRFFDETLGPVALWLIGLIRPLIRFVTNGFSSPAKPRTDQIQTVALIKLAAIGDTVLMSGIIADLKKQNPDVRILLFVGSSNETYARMLPLVDEVICLPLSDLRKSLGLLRARPIDLCLNFDSWPRISAFFAALSSSRWNIGFCTAGQRRHFADDELVNHRYDQHEIENYRDLIRAAGFQADSPPLIPRFLETIEQDPNLIVFHLWAGGTNSHLKEWSLKNWQELLSQLVSKYPEFHFVLTGGPGTQQNSCAAFIESLPSELKSKLQYSLQNKAQSKLQNKAGQSLRETLILLKKARLVVSVDTGVMHLSSAIHTTTVALHGPTSPARWGGIGPHLYSVTSPNPSAGKLQLGFDYLDNLNYLDDLSLDQVFDCCEKALVSTSLQSDSTQAAHLPQLAQFAHLLPGTHPERKPSS